MSNNLIYTNGQAGQPSNNNSEADGFFNSLATDSGQIDQSNTRTEWVSTKHINWEDKPLVKVWAHRDNTTAAWANYNGTTFATVTHGNNGSTELTFAAYTFRVGDVFRYHFNFRTNPSNNDLAANKGLDYFWVKAQLQLDTGAGATWTDIGFDTRNSFGTHRAAAGSDYPCAGYRMYGLTFIYIPNNTGDLTGMRVQVRTEHATMNLNMENWNEQLKVVGA
jgi:hypothetical protein